MSKLLEIFGKAITVNTADLIWHWLNALKIKNQDHEEFADEDFEEVMELLGNMQLDDVEEKLKFYLFENPECIKGRMAAVAVCLHKNQIDQAIEQIQSVYLAQPSNTMALYALGYCYERQGKEAEAIEFYQDCIKFKSHLQLPRQRMAAIYFKSGRLDKTIREYELLTTEHPEDISSQVVLGYLYTASSEYERAIDTFNMAIIAHPDNFNDDPANDEIDESIQQGDFDAAVERVNWLMEQVGDMPDLHVRMADILSKAGKASEAIVHYEHALRAQPNYLEATIKLGTHYLRFQKLALAAEQFNRAVEINDEIVDSYIGLAIAQELSGDTNQAAKTLSLASAIQQNSTLLFSETSSLHLQATLQEEPSSPNQPAQSNDMIRQVIEGHRAQMHSKPRNADLFYKFGILMMVAGDLDQAVKSFNEALEINPTHARVRSKLALCLYETDQVDQAIQTLTAPKTLDPGELEMHYQTAILYCDRQRFAQALCKLENSMNENYSQADAVVNIEVVLENLGLIDRAIATWDRLTEAANYAISAKYE